MFDNLWLVLIAFAVIIGAMVMHFVSFSVLNTFSNVSIVQNNTQYHATIANIEGGINTFDWIVSMFLLGSILYILLSTFIFNTHPFFTFLAFLFGLVSVFVAMNISNVFGDVMQTEVFSSTASAFPITTWIMQNLPIIILGLTVITVVIGLAKPSQV